MLPNTRRRSLVVCQVVPALDGGGVERGTLELAQALVNRGHRSLVVSAGGSLVQRLEQQGSQHITLAVGKKSLTTLPCILTLRRLLKLESIDILHVRSRLPAWIARLAWQSMARHQRPHLVSTVHGLYSVSKYSAVMTHAERVIAVSHTVKDYLVKHYPKLDPDIIRVIHRGIDVNEFPYGYQADPHWTDRWYRDYPQLRGRPVILLPGRLSRIKGHHALIQLMLRLQQQGSNAMGLIVGGHDPRRQAYVDELKQSIQTHQLNNIIFTGPRHDMKEIYAAVDIVLSLSSKPESFGRTVIEALSIGTPVIGYDHGGVGETLAKAFPEGRVPTENIDKLYTKIQAFLSQPPQLKQATPYPLSAMLDQTVALYEDLVA